MNLDGSAGAKPTSFGCCDFTYTTYTTYTTCSARSEANTSGVATYDDEGEEVEIALPGKYEVCPRCSGHGTHLNPSIGEHCYSSEEFEREFADEEDRDNYFKRGGIYDVECFECKGKRVVVRPDLDRCTKEQKEGYKKHVRRLDAERRERESEERFGY